MCFLCIQYSILEWYNPEFPRQLQGSVSDMVFRKKKNLMFPSECKDEYVLPRWIHKFYNIFAKQMKLTNNLFHENYSIISYFYNTLIIVCTLASNLQCPLPYIILIDPDNYTYVYIALCIIRDGIILPFLLNKLCIPTGR